MNKNVVEIIHKRNQLARDINYLNNMVGNLECKVSIAEGSIIVEQVNIMRTLLDCYDQRLAMHGIVGDTMLEKCE